MHIPVSVNDMCCGAYLKNCLDATGLDSINVIHLSNCSLSVKNIKTKSYKYQNVMVSLTRAPHAVPTLTCQGSSFYSKI